MRENGTMFPRVGSGNAGFGDVGVRIDIGSVGQNLYGTAMNVGGV